MGMFSVSGNSFMRDIFGNYPDEKDFAKTTPTDLRSQASATTEELKVLRTYADGSIAMTQRAVPDLLAGLGSAAFQPSKKVKAPDNEGVEANDLMPTTQPLTEIAEKTITDTLLAKTQALTETLDHDTSGMAEANSSNNFKQTLTLTQDLTSSKLTADSKRNVAIALKPLLESFKDTYTNDLKALAAEIPEAQREKLQETKLGAFKGLGNSEIQYVEKYQRLLIINEQLSAVKALI